jgi:transglutaminase-like putative cysteine protease
MSQYLGPTKLCDCDHVLLKKKANEIADGAVDPAQAALRVFRFVRDQILFGMDYPDVKASHTLKKGLGFCIPKTNLQMALLRAVGIPSRCHYVHLPKELIKPISPGFMYDRTPAVNVHPWCECYLSGQWIACEALNDEGLYRGWLKVGLFTREEVPTVDWDGKTDLIVTKAWIQKDIGTFSSCTDGMLESAKAGAGLPPASRLVGWFIFYLFNRKINAIRRSAVTGKAPARPKGAGQLHKA